MVSISLGGQTAEMLLYTTLAINFKSIQGSFCVFSIGGDWPVDRFMSCINFESSKLAGRDHA